MYLHKTNNFMFLFIIACHFLFLYSVHINLYVCTSQYWCTWQAPSPWFPPAHIWVSARWHVCTATRTRIFNPTLQTYNIYENNFFIFIQILADGYEIFEKSLKLRLLSYYTWEQTSLLTTGSRIFFRTYKKWWIECMEWKSENPAWYVKWVMLWKTLHR